MKGSTNVRGTPHTGTASKAEAYAPSVLARGLRIRGRVRGQGDLVVEADIEGEVSVSGELRVEDGASVTGNVEARLLVVSGTVEGDVRTSGAVSVGAHGRLRGDVAASALSIEEGASFDGRVEADFELPAALG
ncbi:MAG: polymer-forming cytoskeletal protein [Polyangiaceae bacterium]|nr:polymer-forming cytoskeletal protein [Polyangiaceae bacterium]